MRLDTYFETGHQGGGVPYLYIDKNQHGRVVKAKYDLEKNMLITRICGPTISYAETQAMGINEYSSLQVDLNCYIKPSYPFYLFNHSCSPNCGITPEMNFVTIRNIRAGEELTWDYSTSMLERHWQLSCTCGSPNCRNLITDFDRLPINIQQQYIDMNIVLPFIKSYLEKRHSS